MKTSRLIAWLMITSLSLSTTGISFAAAPTNVPSWVTSTTNVNGIFSDYFQNLAVNCGTSNELVTGFKSSPEIDFLKPNCTPVKTLLASLFSTYSSSFINDIIVFKPDGTPISLNISSSSSQWWDVAKGIAYTGSAPNNNVVIWAEDPKDGKLYVAGKTIVGDENGNYSGVGWDNALQINGGGTTGIPSIGFNNNGTAWIISYTSAIGFVVGGKKISDFLHPAVLTTLTANSIPKMGVQTFDKNNMVNSSISDNGTNVNISTWLNVVGDVNANWFIYNSDRRLKDNITPLSSSLEKILSLNGYSFSWKSTGAKDIGVIAQEVEAVYPELVHTNSAGYKSVEYGNLIAPLIEAVKSQQKEIKALRAEIETLKNTK